MAIYLFAPYDDELLHGLVYRYIEHMGVHSLSHFRGLTKNSLDLDWWARETAVSVGMTARQIADRLTLRPFLSATRWWSILCNDASHPPQGQQLLKSPRGPRTLRFCRTCFVQDHRMGRSPYWRRSHQLPGSFFCHIHGETLYETGRGLRHREQYDIDTALSMGVRIKLDLTETQKSNCVSLAKMVHWILISASGPGTIRHAVTRSRFRFEFVTPTEEVIRSITKTDHVMSSILDHYGKSFIDLCRDTSTANVLMTSYPMGRLEVLLSHSLIEASLDFMWPKCVNVQAHPKNDVRVNAVKRTSSGWTAACLCGCTFDYVVSTISKDAARFEITSIRLPPTDVRPVDTPEEHKSGCSS
ncbi:TniQ protein [Paraburkholderia steynii]|uniref:TniQ protein n=1 Tax=Paraburkholderia steynii TaxID=1245441 RepID=A0A7Z7BJ27_9BURK|nr:TniQ protein [Paraburkholderia steynii]